MLRPATNQPQQSQANDKRIGASQQQSNRARSSISNNNGIKNKQSLQQHLQLLLKRQFKGCFITTKTIRIYGKTIPSGTAGKVVMSRRKAGLYCCIFAVPYNDIEAQVNPALYLDFGTYSKIVRSVSRFCTWCIIFECVENAF